MKTMNEWFKELPDNIEVMARRNAARDSGTAIELLECDSLRIAICHAFHWKSSNEGFDFWLEVSLGNYENLPEPLNVELAMRRMRMRGGSFEMAISQAWQVADPDNRARIEKAFSDLIERYALEVTK